MALDLVSVIVPVYKVEKYLNRCVESILKQSYPYLNLILIDDGSPDRCGAMCDEWATRDNRIQTIHKQNGGLSSARNAGLNIACGDYICFVDSDDALHPKALEWMIDSLEKNDADVAVGMLQRFNTLMLPEPDTHQPEIEVISGREAMDCYGNPLRERARFVSSCGKLYRRTLFNELRFPEGKLFEDEYTIYKIFYRATKVALVNSSVYYYYANLESITYNLTLEEFCDEYIAWFERIIFLRDTGEKTLLVKAVKSFLYDSQWHLLEARKKKDKSEKICRFIEQYEKVFILGEENDCISFVDDYDYFILSNPKKTMIYRIKRIIFKLIGKMD